MLSNEFHEETNPDYYENNFDEQLEQKVSITDICIPKVEPCYLNISRSNEDTLNTNELLTSPIPFIVPYKIKDPFVVLERCDKIWETLQLIKDAQNKNNINSSYQLSSKKKNSTSYIEYQPVLSNDNAALPDFAFSVKAKKKLYQCSACGKLYTKHITLRLHAKKIHNMYIDPSRNKHLSVHRKSVDKEKDKEKERRKGQERELEGELNVNEKEKRDYEQVYSKKNENMFTGASSQSTTLSSPEHSISDHKKPKIRSNVLLQSSNNINVNEILQKKQGKRTSNTDLEPNETQIFSHHNSSLLTCFLCAQVVKDIKKHLIDYHKIESSDFMVKELRKISPKSKFEELNYKRAVNNEVLKECETVQKHSRVQEKVKRKASVSLTDSRKKCKVDNNDTVKPQFPLVTNDRQQCDVCHRFYEKSSYCKHRRGHRRRGETRENFHLFEDKYLKCSPRLRQKKNSNLNDAPAQNTNNSEHKDKRSSSSFHRKEIIGQMLHNLSKDKEACDTNSIGDSKISCSCGKLFHNSSTLSVHKKSCNLKNKISTAENDLNESDDEQDASDKDLSPGISITIKKKNNSYEIVDRDGENENKLQDSNRSKCTEISNISRNNGQVKSHVQLQDLESFKYSRYHSILKIEPAEEDVYIDIINELQAKSCNNNISETNESVKDLREKEEAKQTIAQTQENNSKRIHEKVLESKQSDTDKLNMPKKYICVCGIQFHSKKAFDAHINKHQANLGLKCGYCKTDFADINTWNKHACTVTCYKQFFDVPIPIICYCCNVTLQTHKQLDDHMTLKHYDSKKPYQCYRCYRRFSTYTARRVHLTAEHSIINCSLCQTKIQNVSNTKSKHEGYHYGLGYPCHLCKKAYSNKEKLKSHKINIHCKISDGIIGTSESFFMNQSLREKDKLCNKSLTHLNKNIELES